MKNIPLNFTVKNIVKFSLYALQLIETELSNAPIIAALKPGRYGLHNLPKGIVLVQVQTKEETITQKVIIR